MTSNNVKKVMENYTSLYVPSVKKEKCNTNAMLSSLVWWILVGYSAYLSFKCSNGFDLGQFALALLFPQFYIIYHIFATNLCNTI